MKKPLLWIAACLVLHSAYCSAQMSNSGLTITLGEVTQREISDKLNGFNIVYAKNPDKLWESGVLKEGIKRASPGFLRYPGGTVTTYYHWKTPTGNGWNDLWDPAYDTKSNLPASEFMDIDEYMKLIHETGAEPMLGVNVNSGFKWNRIEDGIREALDLMQYCKDNGFKVKYWYLGNEPYMHDCNGGSNTVAQYAQMINTFVPRMKAFDPDIKIIINWYATFKKHAEQYEELFKLAGNNIDIVDIHWYCMWGTASWNAYLATTPIGVFTKDSYKSEIELFRQISANNGYPDIKLASLEWNVGPGKKSLEPRLNPARSAMVQTEMMMQFMMGGLDFATFWPLFWDGEFDSRSFFSRTTGELYPISDILPIFSEYHGAKVISTDVSKQFGNMLYFGAHHPTTKEVMICILNKNSASVDVTLDCAQFKGLKLVTCREFALTPDLQTLVAKQVQVKGKKDLKVSIPAYSVSFLTLNK